MWGKTRRSDWFYHFRGNTADTTFLCGAPLGDCAVMADVNAGRYCPKCRELSHTTTRDKYTAKPIMESVITATATSVAGNDSTTLQPARPFAAYFSLDSVHQYDGRQTPAHTLSQEFEVAYLARVLKTAQSRALACSSKLDAMRKDRKASDAIFKFVMEDTNRELEGMLSMHAQAYFGRLDFAVADNPLSESLYIGRSTLEASGFLVYDWRNPVCEMFYQHRPGRASYHSPGGLVQGEMLLKRQFIIQGAEVLSFEDTGGTPAEATTIREDSILLGMLRRNSSGEMRQIVQSIQAEQDRVIRIRGDVVVVQGPAGSGKTVVALHRAAYLLYEKRQQQQKLAQRFGRVSAQRMLVFSPNSLFSSYISRVLPDLNEEQITQTILENTIQSSVRKCLPKAGQGAKWQIERREDFFEYVLLQTDDELYRSRLHASAFKSSVVMLSVLEAFVQGLDSRVEAAFDDMELSIYGQVIADPDERIFASKSDMQERYRLSRSTSSIAESIRDLLQHLESRIKDFEKSSWIPRGDGQGRNPLAITVKRLHQEKQRIESLMLPYLNYQPLDLYAELLQNARSLVDEALTPGVHPQGRTPSPKKEWERETGSIQEGNKYDAVGSDYTLAFGQERKLGYEDVVPLLLLDGHYRGFPHWNDIDHAVIDEAQDYSLLHYEYIRNCLPDDCALTIVGDVNQAISPALNLHDYAGLEDVFTKRITRLELKRSYRSSVEITDFARRILNGSPEIDNVRRTGNKPKLLATPEGKQPVLITKLLAELADKDYNSIAVLCKTRKESAELFRQLRSKLPTSTPVTLLTDSAALAQGVLVVPVQLAKGLEFDAVVLHDASRERYGREEERKLLYTACTRALHDLTLCYSGEPSPLLPIQDSDLYEQHTLQG